MYMKCPNDQATLLISERQNIEIDYCPECRGVWLDRGELDKILERSTTEASISAADIEQSYNNEPHRQKYRSSGQEYKHKKKESFLGDLFDF